MINFLKTHWKPIAIFGLCAIFATALFWQRDAVLSAVRFPPPTPAVDPTPALDKVSIKLDSALAVLNTQEKALKETLAKLKGVEWQLAVATKIQMQNYDSLSAAFERAATVKESDDEIDKLLGR